MLALVPERWLRPATPTSRGGLAARRPKPWASAAGFYAAGTCASKVVLSRPGRRAGRRRALRRVPGQSARRYCQLPRLVRRGGPAGCARRRTARSGAYRVWVVTPGGGQVAAPARRAVSVEGVAWGVHSAGGLTSAERLILVGFGLFRREGHQPRPGRASRPSPRTAGWPAPSTPGATWSTRLRTSAVCAASRRSA